MDRKSRNMIPEQRPFPKFLWRTANGWSKSVIIKLAELTGLNIERKMDNGRVLEKPWATLIHQQDFCQACFTPFDSIVNPKTVNSCGHTACRECIQAKWKKICHVCDERIKNTVG